MTRTTTWLYGWLLLLPAAVLLALFTHYPAVATLWYSFQSTPKGARPIAFVGIDNYRQLADDPIFWQALTNNLWYAAGTIPLAMQTAREEGRLKKGNLVLLASVGAGFTVGATLLRWAY